MVEPCNQYTATNQNTKFRCMFSPFWTFRTAFQCSIIAWKRHLINESVTLDLAQIHKECSATEPRFCVPTDCSFKSRSTEGPVFGQCNGCNMTSWNADGLKLVKWVEHQEFWHPRSDSKIAKKRVSSQALVTDEHRKHVLGRSEKHNS